MDTTPAIEQATCDNCDDEQADFRVIDREFEPVTEEDAQTIRTVRCTGCKSEGTVSVGFDGTTPGGCVSFEEASWNQKNEEEEQ